MNPPQTPQVMPNQHFAFPQQQQQPSVEQQKLDLDKQKLQSEVQLQQAALQLKQQKLQQQGAKDLENINIKKAGLTAKLAPKEMVYEKK